MAETPDGTTAEKLVLARGRLATQVALYRLAGERHAEPAEMSKIARDIDKAVAELEKAVASAVDLSALWGPVETLRTQEIERLKNTGVNADYSRSARHANAYLKALSDLEGLLPPRDTEGPKE